MLWIWGKGKYANALEKCKSNQGNEKDDKKTSQNVIATHTKPQQTQRGRLNVHFCILWMKRRQSECRTV